MLKLLFALVLTGFIIVGAIYIKDMRAAADIDYIFHMDTATKKLLDQYYEKLFQNAAVIYAVEETSTIEAGRLYTAGIYNAQKNDASSAEAAESQLIQAANGGSFRAMDALGYLYDNARIGDKQNFGQALYWYRLAAEKGSIAGNFYLCRYYAFFDEYSKAQDYCEASAEQGIPMSAAILGDIYFYGRGKAYTDKERGRNFICTAISLGRSIPYSDSRYGVNCGRN